MYVNISSPYFKFGDDMDCFLGEGNSASQCFLEHAQMLYKGSENLLKISEIIRDKDIVIDADTHHVGFECDDVTGQRLVDEELAYKEEHEEYEEATVFDNWSIR